jgi:hypothetical protein
MGVRLATLAVVLALGTASASVTGTLALGSASGVLATLSSLEFQDDPNAVPTGQAHVADTTDLSFIGGPLAVSEGVTINNGAPFLAFAPLPIAEWFEFAAHANLVFQLNEVVASGASTNCLAAVGNGSTCSLFIQTDAFGSFVSPVILQNNGSGGTVASITFRGVASDTGLAGLATGNLWSGSFAPTISDMTPIEIARLLCGDDYDATLTCTQADVDANIELEVPSNSGTFVVTLAPEIPEPSTVSLMGIGAGLMVVGFLRRRSKAISRS